LDGEQKIRFAIYLIDLTIVLQDGFAMRQEAAKKLHFVWNRQREK